LILVQGREPRRFVFGLWRVHFMVFNSFNTKASRVEFSTAYFSSSLF
jgi:hypothetical protein